MGDYLYWDRPRVVSVVIALGYVVLAFIKGGPTFSLNVVAAAAFPLACIWFGDEIGSYTGFIHMIPLRETPGPIVRFVGWFLLLVPIPFMAIFSNKLCVLKP